MTELPLFFAMHDVTPFHLRRLEYAEALFQRWGIEKVLYLLVPNYHGAHRADADEEFRGWCAQRRSFALRWYLHGYFHLAVPGAATVGDIESRSDEHSIVGSRGVGSPRSDEGELCGMTAAVLRDRLCRGRQVFSQTLGFAPDGFVPPKWMGGESHDGLLRDLGFSWTEDSHSIRRLDRPTTHRSPVITWATRSPWRKQASLWGCPVLARWWRHAPLLRIAVHPFDFDHPQTVDSIDRVVAAALELRTQAFYAECFEEGGRRAA